MKFLLSIALLALSFSCLAQNETERYVFWQPNVKLTFDMFRGTPTDSVVGKLLDKKVFHCVAVGLWGVLDIPEKKMLRGMKPDKYYFCAAMDKTASFLIIRDSTELKYAQLLWDVCELATRVSRKHMSITLKKMNLGMNTNSVAARMYKTCHNDGKEYGFGLTGGIFDEVILPRNEDAYRFYRNKVDSLLLETEKYATKAEEIERFIRNTPEKGYITPTKIVGDFKNRGEIRY